MLSFNTEWNSSYSGQGGGTGDDLISMDNNWNVGFILKGTKLLSDKNSGNTPPLSVFSYWVLSDVFDESSGPSGSYILGKTSAGTLPFGQVFGLMTFQGIRKAAFNAFKMLNYLGPNRVKSGGGTSSDGVDAMATMSAAGDSLQILAYDQYATLNTTGTDSVTINVSNSPPALSGKQVFVTQFIVDATHSNPYSVWTSQGKPSAPSETQLQALKAAQHLALLQPVSMATLTTSYTATFTINRQAGTLLILSVKRPVTGRDGLGTIEAEDYDGQSGATKEDSNDTDLGQSISVTSGGSVFYDVVDFSDAGVGSVQMRVNASAATNLEFHADSATGTLLGKCAVSATSGWATQSCTLTSMSGVHTLYVVFGGAARLNWLLFQPGSSSTGTGGSGAGTGGSSGTGGVGGKGERRHRRHRNDRRRRHHGHRRDRERRAPAAREHRHRWDGTPAPGAPGRPAPAEPPARRGRNTGPAAPATERAAPARRAPAVHRRRPAEAPVRAARRAGPPAAAAARAASTARAVRSAHWCPSGSSPG